MNKQDKILMDRYNITTQTKTIFYYKEFKYDSLESAVKFAEHDVNKNPQTTSDTAGI